MTQGQAILLVVAFTMAVSIVVSVCVLALALKYELQDRLRRRARRGLVDIEPVSAPVYPLAMHRARREQQGGRRPAA